MDLRLFGSTFLLIFLAELGDKTQLASMAASAGSKAPWSVFAGASTALVLSTLIAILLGSALQHVVPPQALKLGAAVLFFAFGAVLLVSALCEPAEEARVPGAQEVGATVMGRVVLNAAAAFERTAVADYERLAREATSEESRTLFQHLADEERAHLEHVSHFGERHGEAVWPAMPASLPKTEIVADDRARADVIRDAIAHERKTAAFYRELSRTVPLGALRRAFAELEEEENSHVVHLEEFLAGKSQQV